MSQWRIQLFDLTPLTYLQGLILQLSSTSLPELCIILEYEGKCNDEETC